MKIAYLTTIPSTLKAFVVPQAEALHQKYPDWNIKFISSYNENVNDWLPDFVEFISVPMSRGMDFGAIKYIIALKKLFKKEKFDMIVYATPNAALYSSIAGKMAKIPVRVYSQWGIVYVARKGIGRIVLKMAEKTICNHSTFIMPDSLANLEFCRKEKLYDEKKSDVVWNGSATGINLNKFDIAKKEEYRAEIRQKYNLSENDKVIGFVGRFGKEKGCEELIAAFEKIVQKRDSVKLLFVGRIEKTNSVDESVFKYFESNENIIKTGNVGDVEKHLAAMDVFVLPSYREGFGMSVIEAQAMGVPAIVTEYPGPACAILDNESGYVIRLFNSDDIVEAVDKLFSDDLLIKKMGENGRKYVEESFEQTQFMQEMIKNREKLLGIDTDK